MITAILLLCFGAAIAGTGTVIYFLKRDLNYSHTVLVTGTVTKFMEKPMVVEDDKGNLQEGINNLTYFAYDIDGEMYETARYTKYKYEKGQTIELKCNPDNMKDVVEAAVEGKDPKKLYTIMMLFGLVLMIVGYLMLYK